MTIVRFLLSSTVILVIFAAREARAAEPFTQGRPALVVSGRHGFPLGKNISQNPWSNGLGVAYGLTLRGGLYLGVAADSFMFDKGTERYGTNGDTTIRSRLGSATVELGRDWGILKPLVIRWTAGIGAGWGRVEHCSLETQDDGSGKLACSDEGNPRAVAHTNLALLAKISRRFFVLGQGEWLFDTGFDDQTTGAVVALGAGFAF